MEAERFDSPLKVRAVDPITISDYEPGGRLPRERLDHLLCGPLGGWVCGHADVEDSSSLRLNTTNTNSSQKVTVGTTAKSIATVSGR